MTTLNSSLNERYARQTVLPEIREAGQALLRQSRVLVIGAGGLGAPVALYLAAAGIGTLRLADPDQVSLSNLQRQILYETADVGRSKVRAAADRLQELNPDTVLELHAQPANEDTIAALIEDCDIVVDCCDNYATRYLLSHACLQAEIPLIYGAVGRFQGMVSCFMPYKQGPTYPCYRCLHPSPSAEEQNCAEQGIVGAVTGIIGSMQALETIKTLLHIGTALTGRLLRFDGLTGEWKSSRLQRDPNCTDCADFSRK